MHRMTYFRPEVPEPRLVSRQALCPSETDWTHRLALLVTFWNISQRDLVCCVRLLFSCTRWGSLLSPFWENPVIPIGCGISEPLYSCSGTS